jgi:hypothetical protein
MENATKTPLGARTVELIETVRQIAEVAARLDVDIDMERAAPDGTKTSITIVVR